LSIKPPEFQGSRKLKLRSGSFLDFSGPALVMAIVNCNDDSFYPPSRALGKKALEKALAAEKEGAAIVDFGAESTRPGSFYVSCEEELDALIPVIRAFRERSSLPVSVDTRKAAVAGAALEAGADIVNDISALSDDPDMAKVCAAAGAALALMHRKGVPLIMQDAPRYDNLLGELEAYLRAAAEHAIEAGVPAESIIFDPGIGFGKAKEHNIEILRRMESFTCLPLLAEICGKDYPVMVGLSRKSFIGEITGRLDAGERLPGTLAANGAAIMGGAVIIRVHDVKEHVDLAKMLGALRPEF